MNRDSNEERQEVRSVLRALPLFSGIGDDEIERIAEHAKILAVGQGRRLFAAGDPCHGFHTVLSGQVKLAITSGRGDEKVVEIVGPGQSFGEAVMFLDRDYIVSAETLTVARVLFVAKDSVIRELDRDPQLIRRFLGSLSLRLRHLVDDIENLSLLSGRERVVGFLLNGAAAGGGSAEVQLPFKKSLLASRLNVTQEHFSRILHQLSDEGLIEVRGQTIRLCDPERLRAG